MDRRKCFGVVLAGLVALVLLPALPSGAGAATL